MKKKILVAIVSFTVSFCQISLAQSTATAENIIKRYINITGGESKWDSVKSIRFVLESKPSNGNYLRNETIKENPLKYYNKTTFHRRSNPSQANGDSYTEIYNNGFLVNISGNKIDTIKDAKKLDEVKLQTFMLSDLAYKKLNYKINLIGITKVDGVENYQLKFESPNGSILNRFYNKRTGLLTMDQIEDGSKYVYKSYEKVQGFLIPNKFVYVTPAGVIEFTVKEIVFNEIINPEVFVF